MTVLEYLISQEKMVSAPCGGNGTCKGCLVEVKMPSGEVKELLACQTEYFPGMEISEKRGNDEIVGAKEIAGIYSASNFVAVDLGTTTIAMALIDGSSGQAIEEYGSLNSQRAYGADVISRISASNNGKKDELRSAVISDLKKGIDSFNSDFERIVISGNTTMIHLLLDLDCRNLGSFPFIADDLSPSDTVIEELSDKLVCVIPGISVFVGGDIVSGLITLPTDGNSLLVDLGTNGEMALWNEDNYFVSSTSAGPAFEENRLSYGSDSISKLANYLREGGIDSTGLIEDESKCDMAGEDIAKLQLAKSAIRTGIELLLEKVNIMPCEISHLYIAGGFGKHLSVEDAATIGLIPSEIMTVATSIGNSSIDGAIAFGLSADNKDKAKKIIEKAIVVDLANNPKFNDLFAANMMF